MYNSILHILFDWLVALARKMILRDYPDYVELLDSLTDQLGQLLFVRGDLDLGPEAPTPLEHAADGTYGTPDDLARALGFLPGNRAALIGKYVLNFVNEYDRKDDQTKKLMIQALDKAIRQYQKRQPGNVDYAGKPRPGSK